METQELITVIRTDRFNLGFMGRSGSRTMMSDILGAFKPRMHGDIMRTVDSFNDIELLQKQKLNLMQPIPHILVLRNPIDRARAGSRICFHPDYHGRPFLHLINYDIVTHIIKFEEINEYFDGRLGVMPEDMKSKFDEESFENRKQYLQEHADNFTDELYDWNIEDYDFTDEMNLYHKFLEKPVMDPETFKNLRKQILYVNCRNDKGLRIWDM